ncbi:nuclear transport factor 2 family protein [Flavobacterium saccharophilum]|uniref:DUF4440 domain-containing protein n=1 Tax=Flavobacterium saccharophilum TaxID=29534 RepID=A0A1M7FRS5_9FLAO|nr:nuclear transport factor 2 family protein [Flavobacterium saccharophilum]SHM06781.1 protein of unknown function [Flavobacterium saccharophilum]
MKKVLKLLLVFLILISTEAHTQTKSKEIMEADKIAIEKSQILAVTRQFTKLMIDRDITGLNKIVDLNFTLTHITGYVQSKEEWFSEIDKESMKYYSYEEVKTAVTIDGDKAIFTGQNLLDARIWGTRNNWRLQQTMNLEKRNGNWIILKSVASVF